MSENIDDERRPFVSDCFVQSVCSGRLANSARLFKLNGRCDNSSLALPAAALQSALQWMVPIGYQVRPVIVFSDVHAVLSKLLRLDSRQCLYIATAVSQFLGSHGHTHLPSNAYQTFFVALGGVAPMLAPGIKRQKKQRRNQLEERPWSILGKLVRLTSAELQGKVVIVEDVIEKLDATAVSSSLDLQPYFAMGADASEQHSWHASRCHHRWRLFSAPEAAVERTGSVMQRLFDSRQNLAPAPLMARAFLAQAGVTCTGGGRDALLIEEVVHILSLTKKQKHSRRAAATVQHVSDLETRLESSGRWAGVPKFGHVSEIDLIDLLTPSDLVQTTLDSKDLRQHRKQDRLDSLPSELPDAIQSELLRVVSSKCVVGPLPVTMTLSKPQSSQAAPSSARERLDSWLGSNQGQAWQQERDNVWKQYEGR